jgi:hypothetical protein
MANASYLVAHPSFYLTAGTLLLFHVDRHRHRSILVASKQWLLLPASMNETFAFL